MAVRPAHTSATRPTKIHQNMILQVLENAGAYCEARTVRSITAAEKKSPPSYTCTPFLLWDPMSGLQSHVAMRCQALGSGAVQSPGDEASEMRGREQHLGDFDAVGEGLDCELAQQRSGGGGDLVTLADDLHR